MEGAAIAHACHLMEVPFVVVRAISDKAGETTTVDYSAFETKAAEDCAHVVKYMVSHL
jgi:adenosylhomocysteine nucleosidase